MEYETSSGQFVVNLTSEQIGVVIGDAAKMDVEKAVNYIESGKIELEPLVIRAETAATNAGSSATSAAGSASDAKKWAIGDPSEPVGYSAKYWADEAASTVEDMANKDLSNLSAEGEAKFDAKQDVISDLSEIRSGAALGATAVQSVTEGTANGTINVDGTDVSVHGLGSAAYTQSTDYATSSQGEKADTALQPNDNVSSLVNDSGYITGITSSDVTTALGYTPYNSSNPSGYQTSGQVVSAITASIVDNTSTTSTTKSLSANMGKELQDEINNLKARGRFLALWNCATGLAESNPQTNPYVYQTGDYFIVGIVDSTTNYKPNGSSYTIGVASTTVETSEVAVDDVYYYDGINWKLQQNTQKTLAFSNIAGSPYDNTNLASALNAKQDELTAGTDISIGQHPGETYTVSGSNSIELSYPLTVSYVKAFGACSQSTTPTPQNPVNIVCNNGALKWDSVNEIFYADGTQEVLTITPSGDTASVEMLLSINGNTDVQDVLSGTVTRNTKIIVFKGTEDWASYSAGYYVDIDGANARTGAGNVLSTVATEWNFASDRRLLAGVSKTTFPDTSDWKTYLATQYANGTPVIIAFVTETSTTEAVTAQSLGTTDAVNTISVTSASINSLDLEAQYATAGDGKIYVDFTNDTGYITGINSSDVTTALGYTPVNPSSLATVATTGSYTDLINKPANEVFLAQYGVTTKQQISDALAANQIVMMVLDDTIYHLSTFNSSFFVFTCLNGSASNTVTFNGAAWSKALYSLERTSNKVTSLSSASTDTQYPSAKCVYDAIPTVNNATLTITQGGVSKGTFTANASSDVTIALDAGGSGSAAWGSITGTLSNQTDLKNALDAKQDTLTAGNNITIENNVISSIAQESFFRGNFNYWANVPTNASLYQEDIHGNRIPQDTDFIVVEDASQFIPVGDLMHRLTVKNLHATESFTIRITDENGVSQKYYYQPYSSGFVAIDEYYSLRYEPGTPGIWWIKTNDGSPIVIKGITYPSGQAQLCLTSDTSEPFYVGMPISAGQYQGAWRFAYYGVWSTDGTNGWTPQYKIENTLPIASETTVGITKLYTTTGSNTDGAVDQATVTTELSNKQETLVSGTNIKTINNNSILGSGDLSISASASWGNITGTLSNQTDLNNALNAKYDASNPNGYTSNVGTVTSVNNVSPVNGNVTLSIPAAQVNSDWNAVSGVAQILNKPSLATVATSGAYSDLTGTPSLSGYQTTANLVTSVSSSSTDSQYPSAKLFYDTCGDIETLLQGLR